MKNTTDFRNFFEHEITKKDSGFKEEYIGHVGSFFDREVFFIMNKNGNSFVSLYTFYDTSKKEYEDIYISYLSVHSYSRKKGLGTEIIKLCEKIATELNTKFLYLAVIKDSWMQKWYEKLGFEYDCECDLENHIWLKKKLNK